MSSDHPYRAFRVLLAVVALMLPAAVGAQAPIGSIVAWPGQRVTFPAGWIECDGSELLRSQYPTLFNVVGTVWGGTATTKFKLPDLRGYFLRGVDGGTNRDPDAQARTPSGSAPPGEVGSVQAEDFKAHAHQYNQFGGQFHGAGPDINGERRDLTVMAATTAAGGNETRPKNAYVYWLIKVQ